MGWFQKAQKRKRSKQASATRMGLMYVKRLEAGEILDRTQEHSNHKHKRPTIEVPKALRLLGEAHS